MWFRQPPHRPHSLPFLLHRLFTRRIPKSKMDRLWKNLIGREFIREGRSRDFNVERADGMGTREGGEGGEREGRDHGVYLVAEEMMGIDNSME